MDSQKHSEDLDALQRRCWENDNNYEVVLTGSTKDCVAIYFTSNDLFYPHDCKHFKYSVIERNYYEWRKSTVARASKHIFVRDIYKQWYANGINARINCIDAIVEWLKDETEGYREKVCIGSSAGGYMAALVGSLIQADLCFTFNGQWEVETSVQKDGHVISPILKDAIDCNKRHITKYFSIKKWVANSTNIFYFHSNACRWDASQFEHIAELDNIHVISFNTSHHGIPFLKVATSKVINLSKEELLPLASKRHNPIRFSAKMVGWNAAVKGCLEQYTQAIKRRLR